jgi:membrane-associated phospholipid phosphatase
MSGDRHDFLLVNDFARRTAWLHEPLRLYAQQGVVLFAVLLLVGYLLARRSGSILLVARSLLAGLGVLIAIGINQPIVHAVNEPRPYRALPHALLLVHASADGSFPSDHATMAGAVAAGLLFVNRKLGLAAALAAILMAFARVYVGAHYPVDVLGGLVVGAVGAALVQLLAGPLASLLARLERTSLRPLLRARTT